MAEEKKAEASVSFKVSYFAFTGRAAPLRLALAIGGIPFEDEFVTREEHKKAKEDGSRRWSGLPELTVYENGKEKVTIGQSMAQLRYLGRLTGLYGSNAFEGALIDEILDALSDASAALRYNGETDKDKQKALREAAIAKDGKLTYFLNKFVLRLKENEARGCKNGFIVGDSLTIADIQLAGTLEVLTSGFYDYIPKDLFTKNYASDLAPYIKKIGEVEKIKEFNAKFQQRLADFKDDAKKASVKCVKYDGSVDVDVSGDSLAGIQGVEKAVCILNPDGGSGVSGKIFFEKTANGTKITGEVKGLTKGKHGFHIHQLGDLSGGCKTAKGHFNPFGKNHGGPDDEERHVGDLGNIEAGDDGCVTINIAEDKLVQLNGKNSIVGRSIVVHADEDDLGKGGHEDSLTTGHAGARVACGVIGQGN